MLIWRAVFYVGATVTSATLGALSGMNWSQADGQTRFMVVLGVFGTIAGTLGAFVDQAVQRVAKGEAPFVDVPLNLPGTREETVTLQKSTVTTPPAS